MSSLLITTSRKPSVLTRKLCRWLAFVLKAECENRGKRSLPEMEQLANKKGRRRLLFIGEKNGNPSTLSFFEDEWIWPEIVLKNVKMPQAKPSRSRPATISFNALDKKSEEIAQLFLLEKESEPDVEMIASKNKIEFMIDGKASGLELTIAGFFEGKKNESDN
ncbi:MAG TPA: hypothetical protein VGQ00_00955 [Candidatus Norongarragalinales archaeon]|nr:hypothetical protein [Candidatus Norongarragalinales archaeon]